MTAHIEYIKDEFATDEFIANNQYFYDKYIDYRIQGFSSQMAFCRAFGASYLPSSAHEMFHRFEQMESTSYYVKTFEEKLKAIPVDKLWSDKLSVHELLSLARSGVSKCSTRLAAVKELNVFVGITVENESGRSKAVKTLDDFYSDNTKSKPDTSSLENNPSLEGAADQKPAN